MDSAENIETSYKQEYSFSNDTGDAKITVYHIFPGVEVAYASVHMDHFDFKEVEKVHRDQYVGFHCCKEGRIEQEIDNDFFYLMPGDCSVVIKDKHLKKFSFPMKHYHGISIGLNLAAVSDMVLRYWKYCHIDPMEIGERICGENHSAILRSNTAIESILSDFYHVKEEQRLDYLKVKITEFLYILRNMETSDLTLVETIIPRAQVEFVKQAGEYISENINEKMTVKDLTMKFGVSATYLQNSFRLVYGMPVISFIRAQKMQSAAQVLIHTTRSVDEIAEEFGYTNESKFSAVFKKIMGDLPSTYRKEHSKIKIL